jgi:hypothetical protein
LRLKEGLSLERTYPPSFRIDVTGFAREEVQLSGSTSLFEFGRKGGEELCRG